MAEPATFDWGARGGRGCLLCGLRPAEGGWGYADGGPLCCTGTAGEADCYTLWTVRGRRPEGWSR